MPVKILMPSMSPTMTQGTITKWLKNEGDAVESGDVLAEIETDKATMELEAVETGRLAKILHGAGSESVPVHEPIAILLSEGEDERALSAMVAEPKPAPAAAPTKPVAAAPAQKPVAAKPAPPPVKAGPPSAKEAPARLFASPLAKRIAGERGIDLGRVQGSGPRGRIVVRDVEGIAPAGKMRPAVAAPLGEAPYVETSLSTMRRIIAERMSLSKREAPHFYLTIDCEVDALVKGRAELNATLAQTPEAEEQEEAAALTLNDFLIRAAALALVKVPEANVAYVDGKLRQYGRADVAVAVAVPGGLVTPIIFDAANKGLGQIAAEMRALTARAQQAKLMAEEYQGGTFTISNLGMFGIRAFAAVLNPPQACLLAVGRAEKRAVVKNDAVVPATLMTCTLSIDHRAVDGAIGARFLSEFKRLVEQPLAMLL